MKVLIVDPDTHRAPALQQALIDGGAEVTVAPNGSFALTMLEWNRHDVVVSRALIDDMGGHELCAILKADPSTHDVRFVLVAGADELSTVETTAAGVDLVLPPNTTSGAILPLVVRLLRGDHAPAPPAEAARPTAPALPPAPPRPMPLKGIPSLLPEPAPPSVVEPPKRYATAAAANGPATWKTTPVVAPSTASGTTPGPDLLTVPSGMFQGSLEVMDLAELTQAIAVGVKTGRLILALGRASGLLVFDKGRVVHAEYRGAVGEEAFGALLAAAHGEGAGRFCFVPSAGGAVAQPRTIDKSVDQLLLSTATAIDEKG